MKDTYTAENQNKKIEKLRDELQGWKSNLYFIKDEIMFIDHLLNSYVFQPNTHNLFERLQDYLHRLKKTTSRMEKLQKLITVHEKKLGGMMECTDEYCDLQYYQKHNLIKEQVGYFISDFRELKSQIFNYASGILKKRRPANNT